MSYGTGSGYGYGYEPQPQRGTSGVVIGLIVLASILLVALLGAIAYLFLRPGGVDGDPGGQSAAHATSSQVNATPTASNAPVTETEYTTPPEQETVTVTRSAQSPQVPVAGYPAGADSSGWTSNTQARCNAGDPATMIGRTTGASFSICMNPDNGRHYYRGSASGSGVEVDDPMVAGATATVRNNGVVYSISSGGMIIYENGAVISSQPMVDFWAG